MSFQELGIIWTQSTEIKVEQQQVQQLDNKIIFFNFWSIFVERICRIKDRRRRAEKIGDKLFYEYY